MLLNKYTIVIAWLRSWLRSSYFFKRSFLPCLMIRDTDALKTLRNSAFVHNHSFSPSWPALAQGFRRAKKTVRWPRGSTDEARSSPGSDSGNETGPGTHWHVCFWPDRGNTAIAPQIITDCGNLTLDFMQLGLWASPPFLQTLGPWFPNEIQNLLSSEKRTLDHWATVQFFFSLAQVRRLWRCLWFRSGLTRGIRQL